MHTVFAGAPDCRCPDDMFERQSVMSEFLIESVSRITPSDADSVSKLVRQLSKSAKIPAAADLDEVAGAEATSLLVARVSGTIVGMLTLVLFRIPTGVRAIIEDVVVDEAYRGRGIAEALTREALARSNAQGARTVDLTSRPSRGDANRLYQRLGFQRRDSNVYRFSLE
jgi:ribosomal protein S18 acetylase RimI-like enzyme